MCSVDKILLLALIFLAAETAVYSQPTIDLVSDHMTLDEQQTTPKILGTPDCSDLGGNSTTLTLYGYIPSSPCGSCFGLASCPTSPTKWCLTFTPDPSQPLDKTQTPTYTLTLKCTTSSGETVLKDVWVNVEKVFKAPVFENLSTVVSIVEKKRREVTLDTFQCTDPNNGPVVVTSPVPVRPPTGLCAKCFATLPCGADWCIKYYPNVGTLELTDVGVYFIDVTCKNQDGNETTSVVEVRVTQNAPPEFQLNPPIDVHPIPNAQNVAAGEELYSVQASDANNDAIYYTMTTIPNTGTFQIGFTDGKIRTNGSLSQACTPVVTWLVYITDNINPKQGPLTITATLQNSNTAPEILNMDEKIELNEGVQTWAYWPSIKDDQSLAKLEFIFTTRPTSAADYLEFFGKGGSTGHRIRTTTNTFDYESPIPGTRVQVFLQAIDMGGCKSDVKYLDLTILDVNEPPEFTQTEYITVTDEGQVRIDPVWTVIDPDSNDYHTFSITGGAPPGWFDIDHKTGIITSLIDYDIDQNRMTSTMTFSIEVTDLGGLTSNTTLEVKFRDINDNAPVITDNTKTFTITECTPPGTTLGRLTCTDDDSSYHYNNVTHFLPVVSGPVVALTTGQIILTRPMAAGDVEYFTVYAEDQGVGGKLRSQTGAYISVKAKECIATTTTALPTTPTPTTTPIMASTAQIALYYSDWIEENLPWITLSAILATLLMALMIFMCKNYGLCRPGRSRHQENRVSTAKSMPVEVVTPPPMTTTLPRLVTVKPPASPPKPEIVGPQDGVLHSFWKEKYNEEDHPAHPNRDSKPAPATLSSDVTSDLGSSFGDTASHKGDKGDKCCIM